MAEAGDLVYNPLETVFLHRARRTGVKTIDGLGMFIHQGAFAFEKWIGQQAPVCLEALETHKTIETTF